MADEDDTATALDIMEQMQQEADQAQDASAGHRGHARARHDFLRGFVCGCDSELEPPSESFVQAAASTAAKFQPQELSQAVGDSTGVASAVHPADPVVSAVELIDPSRPYTPDMIEAHILDACNRLESGLHYQRVCEEQYAEAVLAWEFAKAEAILEAYQSGGAKDVREAKALMACKAEFKTMNIAKIKVDAIRSTMHSLRSKLSGYQSVARSIQSTWTTTGGGSGQRR